VREATNQRLWDTLYGLLNTGQCDAAGPEDAALLVEVVAAVGEHASGTPSGHIPPSSLEARADGGFGQPVGSAPAAKAVMGLDAGHRVVVEE
jgi:hypothetical protein